MGASRIDTGGGWFTWRRRSPALHALRRCRRRIRARGVRARRDASRLRLVAVGVPRGPARRRCVAPGVLGGAGRRAANGAAATGLTPADRPAGDREWVAFG